MSRSQLSSEVVVMLVGDPGASQKSLQALLRREGLCVLTVDTGEEALDLSRRFVDKLALIADTEIGQMTGVELYRRIREHRPETKALLVGDDDSGLRERFPELVSKVKQFLGTHY